MKRIASLGTMLSLLLLIGCTVGPNYKRPQVSVPKQWTVAPARGTSTKPPETDEWWSSFQDPELNSRIERAVGRNLDLKLALERVQEARAARGVVRSGHFPSLDANVSATRLRGGFNQGVVRVVPSSIGSNSGSSLISPFETNVFQGNLSVSWELDVFGGIRRAVEAATADVAAAVKASKGGAVEFRVEKAGIVQAGVGKVSFDVKALEENVRAFADAVNKAKPAGAKGNYVKRVSVTSTMGPGLKLDIATLAAS